VGNGGLRGVASPLSDDERHLELRRHYNIGSYCDKKADQPTPHRRRHDPAAVKAEADYLTLQQPGLFQPVVDQVVTWKNTISGTPASFASLTQFQLNPEFWYTKK
jgi:hypothetical protein